MTPPLQAAAGHPRRALRLPPAALLGQRDAALRGRQAVSLRARAARAAALLPHPKHQPPAARLAGRALTASLAARPVAAVARSAPPPRARRALCLVHADRARQRSCPAAAPADGPVADASDPAAVALQAAPVHLAPPRARERGCGQRLFTPPAVNRYISHLLGHESEGSLLSLLKGLASHPKLHTSSCE